MRRVWIAVVVVCVSAWSLSRAAEPADKRLTLELGDAVTFGSFSSGDATIDVETEFVNPQIGVELRLTGPLSVGLSYAQSKNDFSGDWSGDEDNGEGEVTAERTDINAYLRLGNRDAVNARLGYRYFKYQFSDGEIRQSNGEVDRNCEAEGDMTTGIDGELNLLFGKDVTAGVGLGITYFMDAEYTWSYDKVVGGSTTHETGSATVNGYSGRIRPEVSVKVNDTVRVFLNYTLQATLWEGTPDNGRDYPGVDIYSAAMAGVRLTL